MFFFGIVIGVVLGYLFKPQLDKVVIKAINHIKKKNRENKPPEDY